MTSIETIATSFHHARMTGEGWQAGGQHCTPETTLAHEGEVFADIHTREA